MTSTLHPDSRAGGATVSERPSYSLRIARSAEDIKAAQLLRFMVFNVELREGLEQSFDTCLDEDRFDPVCDHLLVEETATREIVGTYRLQTGLRAAERLGYYCEQEFDFRPYEPLRGRLIELGRACIHSGHRSFAVLNLLWRGIARHAQAHGARYLIGCSSLTSQDPADGAAAYLALHPHLVTPELRTRPISPFVCSLDTVAPVPPKIPKLLAAYLALGARICGPPALDRDFKTIDFLTLLDLQALPFRTLRRLTGMQDGDPSGDAADISA